MFKMWREKKQILGSNIYLKVDNMKCKFAPKGINCDNCPFGTKNAPVGSYANGCEIREELEDSNMELREE